MRTTAQSGTMEGLPVDALAHVLEFLDIPARIKLARCNRAFERKVYRECLQAWKTIHNFGPFRERLKDAQLAQLLTRVNARDVTVKLDISSCRNVRGPGLMPIQNSYVLETVLLTDTGANFDLDPFFSTLEHSIPHKLAVVKFRDDGNSPGAIGFVRKLSAARWKRAHEEDIHCVSCREPVAHPSLQLVPDTEGMPIATCVECNNVFCRKGSCPTDVQDCISCKRTLCNDCCTTGQCSDCGMSYCNDCFQLASCFRCGKAYCVGLPCGSALALCRGSSCCKWMCCEVTCSSASELAHCTNDCRFCHDCVENGDRCAACGDLLCSTCSDPSICNLCSKQYCTHKSSCSKCFEWCGVCRSVVCSDCGGMERCHGCNNSFCKHHDRLVHCETCEMRHCRACIQVKRCRQCFKACYEKCSCGPEPWERPTKKRRF